LLLVPRRPTLTADRLRTILKASDVWQAEMCDVRAVRRLLKDRLGRKRCRKPSTRCAGAPPTPSLRPSMPSRSSSPACTHHQPTRRPIEKRMRAASQSRCLRGCLGVVPDAKDRAAVVALMKGTFPALVAQEIERVVG